MDNMLEHPGIELQILIKEKGLTQKAFSSILGKKVSEVNELLKGKRNITIQRDYLLHQTLGTPIKYWILKQIDYDYSLLYIEETEHQDIILSNNEGSMGTDSSSGASTKNLGGEIDESYTKDSSLQTPQNNNTTQTKHPEQNKQSISYQTHHSDPEIQENPSNTALINSSLQSKSQTNTQGTPVKEGDSKNNEDLKNRAKIFRTF